MSAEKRSVESLKLEHSINGRIFTAILTALLAILGGTIVGWLLDKIIFDVETIERLIILMLLVFIVEKHLYDKMRKIRDRIGIIERQKVNG